MINLRLIIVLFVLLGSVFAAEPQYPLWDGHESVADYAKKVNLPPTKTLDLGNGVKMELVLIPAGKFMMGTPAPVAMDKAPFQKQIIFGLATMAVGAGILLVLMAVVAVYAVRKRQRPKFSL